MKGNKSLFPSQQTSVLNGQQLCNLQATFKEVSQCRLALVDTQTPHTVFGIGSLTGWIGAAILWSFLGQGSIVLVVVAAAERVKVIVCGVKGRIKKYQQTMKQE